MLDTADNKLVRIIAFSGLVLIIDHGSLAGLAFRTRMNRSWNPESQTRQRTVWY